MFISKKRYNDLLVRLEKCEFDMKYVIECKPAKTMLGDLDRIVRGVK
ncbi:MAG: hypothetical protein IJ740_05030 [Ruminococcus sp.]|nr:hypothetical protein [Ruminococcus sp.]